MKILITGATGAKAYQLKNKLGGNNVLLGDFAELPLTMLKNGLAISLPQPTNPAYAHLMLTLCLDNGVEQVYTLSWEEWAALGNSLQLFAEYGITILSGHDEI